MWFKHRAWIPTAWVLALINLGSVWFAARPGETWHATGHALFAVLFALGAQRLTARRRALLHPEPALGGDRIKGLEYAIDAIAVELERVGEGQRFVTKMLADRGLALERAKEARQRDPEGA